MQLALDHGFTVETICFRFRNWSDTINAQMKAQFEQQGVQFHIIEAGREAGFNWLTSVVQEKFYRSISGIISLRGSALATAVSRRNSLLLQALKQVRRADWVIGHNPGALYATLWAAKKLQAKAGFDVEDYHPGEGHHLDLQKLSKKLMQEVLPAMDYVSFAAPLIREAVKNDLGKEGSHWITILNYFPAAEFVAPVQIEGPLRLVWFSQNISAGRGLEYILPIVQKFEGEMELHLFGNMDENFYEAHLIGLQNVIVHLPLAQKALHIGLSKFDVGLALEPKKDLNNDLAVSNKLLAYMQAGLFVFASDTAAQKQFLKNFSAKAEVVNIENSREIEIVFTRILENKERIRAASRKDFQQCSELSSETALQVLLDQLKQSTPLTNFMI